MYMLMNEGDRCLSTQGSLIERKRRERERKREKRERGLEPGCISCCMQVVQWVRPVVPHNLEKLRW